MMKLLHNEIGVSKVAMMFQVPVDRAKVIATDRLRPEYASGQRTERADHRLVANASIQFAFAACLISAKRRAMARFKKSETTKVRASLVLILRSPQSPALLLDWVGLAVSELTKELGRKCLHGVRAAARIFRSTSGS